MNVLFELARVPLSLLASCSAGAGFLLAAAPRDASRFWVPMAGVFLLSCGASALNQVQERKYDALMERTKDRPLPSGRISPASAVFFAMIVIVAGLALLLWAGGLQSSAFSPQPSAFSLEPVALGLFSIIWYNVFYTYAKRASAFAAVPGALVGAVPPAIGWTLAGGSLFDPPLGILMVFLFLWQVPHFWLLLLLHEREYREAGYPVLTDRIPPARLKAVAFSWIAAASAICLLMPLFGLIHSRTLYLLGLGPALAALFLCAWRWILRTDLSAARVRHTFIVLNAFALAVLLILSADRLLLVSSKFQVPSSKFDSGDYHQSAPDSQLSTLNSQLGGREGRNSHA